MNTLSTIDLETSQEVFVLNTDGKSSGTANTGTIYIPYGAALKYNTPFCLKMTSFNTLFSAPNISAIRGNTMQFDDGNVIRTVILPTGSYSVGGSADLGSRLAALMTSLDTTINYTASYDDATNKYTKKGTAPFRFVFTNPDKKKYCNRLLGFDTTVTQTLSMSQTASFVPHLYENEFHVYIEANNAVTDVVSMPRSDKVVRTSFIIPRTLIMVDRLICL